MMEEGLRASRWGGLTIRIFRLLPIFVLLSACGNLAVGGNSERDVVFHDDFEDALSGGWHLEADAQGRAEVVDGKLLMTISAPATVQYVTLEDKVFSDFILDVEASQVAGPAGSSYGVLVRMVAPGQFYRFEVTSNGEYIVERHEGNGVWTRLTDGWQDSAAILQGTNRVNHLRVAAVEGRFSFYANDTLLTQVFDDSYVTGAMALDAGTFNQSELQVAFDNVIISSP